MRENPRVASYARGADYHDVLPARMKELVQFIEEQVGGPIKNRYYTDTGPILERDLAQRAGIGWIGKNTCLINPKQGSYFLLSEILITARRLEQTVKCFAALWLVISLLQLAHSPFESFIINVPFIRFYSQLLDIS